MDPWRWKSTLCRGIEVDLKVSIPSFDLLSDDPESTDLPDGTELHMVGVPNGTSAVLHRISP